MKIANSASAYIRGVYEAAVAAFTRLVIVCIDPGYSSTKCAAFLKSGEVLPVRDRTTGQVAVPSVILVKEKEVLTGFAAEREAKLYPERVIRNWKSALGTDEVLATIDGIPRTPRWCLEQVMRDTIASASVPLGSTPTACVLMHPGNATQAFIQDLVGAAESLNLRVAGVVAESTGAVYGYDAFETGKRYVAVSDWGAWTADVTILDVSNPDSIKVIAVLGTAAGGDRVTESLIERCRDRCAAELSLPSSAEMNSAAWHELREQCEQMKLAFSVCETGLVVVRDGDQSFQQEFALQEFLACVEPVEEDLFAAIDGVLVEKGIDSSEVHWVGAGRAIRTRGHLDRFERRFGKLHCDLDSDTAISKGGLLSAARQLHTQGEAARFDNLPSASELATIEDVNHTAFGIIVNRWKGPLTGPIPLRESDIDPTKTRKCLDAILDRWQPLGDEKVAAYSPSYREQRRVQIRIVEGPKDGADPNECTELGSFMLDLIPASERNCIGRIEIRASVDSDSKLVTVTARDLYGPEDQQASGTVHWDAASRAGAHAPKRVEPRTGAIR